jgi:hypothetical protein
MLEALSRNAEKDIWDPRHYVASKQAEYSHGLRPSEPHDPVS